MKYFTLESWINDQDFDKDINPNDIKLKNEYDQYRKMNWNKFPTDFTKMLETICIEDSALREFKYLANTRSLSLIFDAGDITMQTSMKIKLIYLNTLSITTYADPSKGVGGPYGYGDLGKDEIEILNSNIFEHRILFSSGIEMQIQFKDFRLEIL